MGEASVLRVGLIGFGRIAERVHATALGSVHGVRLTAIADTDPARLAAAAAAVPGTVLVPDYEALLLRDDVDAVVIALPTSLHSEAAVAAFGRGKHVYVEKPLATSVAEGAAVVEAWRAAGTVGAVGYAFRFHSVNIALKEALAAGAIGEIVAVRTAFGSAPRALPGWKTARATGGGALIDLASHHIDLARFLFEEEVVEVGAVVCTIRSPDDTCFVELVLEDGLVVQTLASASAVPEDRVEVYGIDGKLVASRLPARPLEHVVPSPAASGRHRRTALRTVLRNAAADARGAVLPPRERSFGAALRAFADAARGSRLAGASIDDGYRALAVVEAAKEAARTGRRTPVLQAQALG